MQISDEELRKLITKIAEVILASQAKAENKRKTKIYVIAPNKWDERYLDFFRENRLAALETYAVIPEVWQEEKDYVERLIQSGNCKGIVLRKAISFDRTEDFLTVFPVVTKNVLAKTALCLADDFETEWIEACLEEGKPMFFLKSGLKKFTGKETKTYVEKVMSYYRTVLSYGINITDIEELLEVSMEGPQKER